ncbi:hypothetical protein [Streptomyces naganishii]|uniref:Uncharacterized protein n=1 Tax=Streptomyces naganishii JCM 4654 TaxID=1306179 RepID=A0A918Y9F1_9ACTN|nr:hypothetical protein [Streptomyces naganishii]GHD94784.1 hypothetical protein GCM10010508_56900 [Streptomyces naganishii JCM 4654]
MFAYEIHRMRSAELRAQADRERLALAALRGRRAGRRSTGQEAPVAESHSKGSRRHRFTRAA